MHKVEYRRDLNLLDITWSGLFAPEDIESYKKDCIACWQAERFTSGYALRITLSDDKALPQQTLARLLNAFSDFPRPKRTAMVTRGAIARLQIKRALMKPDLEIFEEADGALDWLLGPEEAECGRRNG